MPTVSRPGWPALASLGGLLAIVIASPSPAAELVVRPDRCEVTLRTPDAIENEKAEHGRVAKIVEEGGSAATNILVYLPPSGSRDLKDTLSYDRNGQHVTVPIAVQPAGPTLTDPEHYERSFRALFALFILAVVVESGLALIFRWKPFLDYFDSRTVNAIVAFAFSLIFVRIFELDLATALMNTYSGTHHLPNDAGMLLTALIIAGGSAGVNRLFQALGFRAPSSERAPIAKPPPSGAWIAVSLVRAKAVGPVAVVLTNGGQPQVAGTIGGVTHAARFWRSFLRDKGRFPQTGGFSVTPEQPYEVVLKGIDRAGAGVSSRTWGPYAIAKGAIVDIELTA